MAALKGTAADAIRRCIRGGMYMALLRTGASLLSSRH